ncbi:hypothetical protein GA0115244_104526 [Streptomyces sp. DvalAA-19]|nr:hypothetical protein GA0115244_104526 [Streptomyces sp. DvalAA-19]
MQEVAMPSFKNAAVQTAPQPFRDCGSTYRRHTDPRSANSPRTAP